MANLTAKTMAIQWICGRGLIGLVAVRQANGRWNAYIDVAKGCYSPELNTDEIARWGTPLSKSEALAFFPDLPADRFDDEAYDKANECRVYTKLGSIKG